MRMRIFNFSIDATREPKLTVREPMGDELLGLTIADVEKLITGLSENLQKMKTIDNAINPPRNVFKP